MVRKYYFKIKKNSTSGELLSLLRDFLLKRKHRVVLNG